MTRHRAIAAVAFLAVLALSGCSAAGSLDMKPAADDAALAEELSRPASVPAADAGDELDLVRRAITNGSATSEGRRPAVDPGLPYAYEDRYYNVTWSVLGRQPATQVDVAVDYNGSAPASETVAFEELSAQDREMLSGIVPPRTDRRVDGPDVGTSATYNESSVDRSVLLAGEYEGVRYGVETYLVRVEDTDRVTIETYRYEPHVVANSSSEYAEELRSEYLFTLSGLSSAEHELVREAVEGSYYAEDDDDAAFRSLLERFWDRAAVERNEYRGTWIVEWDGSVYVAELGYEGFEMG